MLITSLTMTLEVLPALQDNTLCLLTQESQHTHRFIVPSQDWRYATFYLQDLVEDHTYIL